MNVTAKEAVYSALARPALQPLYDRLLGYLLRLKGFNNFPRASGDLGISGEDWMMANVLAPHGIRCALDVGANKGAYALALLQTTQARVFAVEPLPAMASAARKLTAPFGERCVVLECAVSDQAGRATLRYSPSKTENASLSSVVTSVAYQAETSVEVEVTTVDELVARHGLRDLDFLKLDVEGLELPCLRGARKTIAELRPAFVQVEMAWEHIFTASTVYALAELLPGYHAYRLLPRALVPINPRASLDNLFAFCNLLFARERITSLGAAAAGLQPST